jgi:cyclopropane-fatty-acyl-phospholipid synthase
MNHGHLRIQTANGEYIFPVSQANDTSANEHDDLHAELRVLNNSFWIRLALMSDLGFSEVRPTIAGYACGVIIMFIRDRDN